MNIRFSMLPNFVLICSFLFLTLASWLFLSGSILVIAMLMLVLLVLVVWNYADKAILYFLGAREIMSSDEPNFFQEATQQAYKLSIKTPSLYFYNGLFERAFVLQNGEDVSLVLSRSLLDRAGKNELSVICFSLLLQVKKRMAPARTKSMLILGLMTWLVHGLGSIVAILIPSKNFKESVFLLLNFFLHPWLRLNFKLLIGERYFKRLGNYLTDFPEENNELTHFYLKIRHPNEIFSHPSRRLIELFSSQRSSHYQNVLSLELLPHEWDYYQQHQEGLSDKEVARA